jgi:hypothetical protein
MKIEKTPFPTHRSGVLFLNLKANHYIFLQIFIPPRLDTMDIYTYV